MKKKSTKYSSSNLGTENIGKLVFRLSVPTLIAQIINVLYNIIDRIYIGHIPETGSLALTGLGLTFPIILIITAFSGFVGSGGAPLAAIELGKGNIKKAEQILGNGVKMILIFSVALTAFFFIFNKPLLFLFGASDVTIDYALDYIQIYIFGTLFVQLALGLNPFINSQGQAKIGMFSVLIGAVANILLDPLFIFVFDMGVRGAAIATIISQGLSATWVLIFLTSKKTDIKILASNFKLKKHIVKKISALGISTFVIQMTEGLIFVVLNSGLQRYGGDLHVGAMTIIQSVMQLIMTPIIGFNQGAQPVVSYNYGAKKNERVKQAMRIILGVSFGVSFIFTTVVCIFPELFAKMFTSEPILLDLVNKQMPIFIFGISIFGIQMGSQAIFIGLGQAKVSLFLASLRKIILLSPLAIILPIFWGVEGIYFAEPISDIISAITSAILFVTIIPKVLDKKNT